MIKVILWDIDGTLLNFRAAERAGIRKCFEALDMGECSDEMLERYSAINDKYWKLLELGEKTKSQILVERFVEFFTTEGLDVYKAEDFNKLYQLRLGDTVVFNDDSYELICELNSIVKNYGATNGTEIAQNAKLKNSGFDKALIKTFISDVIGAEKPSKEFFNAVFSEIGGCQKDEVLIVGDSLTSDVAGGNNAGIKTCWYNPDSLHNTKGCHIDYEIKSLWEIRDILESLDKTH